MSRARTTPEHKRELARLRQQRRRSRLAAGRINTELGEIGEALFERGDIDEWDIESATAVVAAIRRAFRQIA
ncbi:hypothetical protein ACSBOB_18590 [Mesorhizobium sp. ASY16-5R]|uniref:hypothetical protein n=1 Tax=Mesorhizobium sp. ASY16-5R TaxID=3445772 RepID=UPI003F9F7F08